MQAGVNEWVLVNVPVVGSGPAVGPKLAGVPATTVPAQLNWDVMASSQPGSLKFTVAVAFPVYGLKVNVWPVLVGATLVTTTVVVYSLAPPSLSMIRPLTVYEPLSP